MKITPEATFVVPPPCVRDGSWHSAWITSKLRAIPGGEPSASFTGGMEVLRHKALGKRHTRARGRAIIRVPGMPSGQWTSLTRGRVGTRPTLLAPAMGSSCLPSTSGGEPTILARRPIWVPA